MTPEVSSRCMAVAHVFGLSSCSNTFCLSRCERDNEVVFSELKQSKCKRTQQHTELVPAIEERYILYKARVHCPSLEIFGSLWEKYRRINICFWVHLHDLHEYPLCPTPVSDPVGYNCYFFSILVHVKREYVFYKKRKTKEIDNIKMVL